MTRLIRHRRMFAGPAALFGLALIFFSAVFLTSGGSAHGQASLVSTSPADIYVGSQLFEEHCQACHGYQGSGNDQVGAPSLINAGAAAADFYLSTGRMPLNSPSNQAVRSHPYFTAAQIRQLVAYVNALPEITGVGTGGPTIPTVAPVCTTAVAPNPNPDGCVTLSQGEPLFAVDCAQCHQAAGAGGILSKGNVVPSLYNANLTQVAEAIRIGPKPMPTFSEGTLSAAQMSAVANYVEYLHHAPHPGGLPIAHFGPVPEGIVGILAGFIVLLFVVRMIGTRG